MTNEELIKNWKTLIVKFNSENDPIPMMEMFLFCSGETAIDVCGTIEIVVIFYQGYHDKGSPAMFFQSDVDDNCLVFGYDSSKKTHIKSIIGKFLKSSF
jgi:hypothetical protein